MRNQPDGLVRAGRTHVRQFLFARSVHFHILLARIFSNDHAFINVDAGAHEQLAALLNAPQRIGGGNAGAVRD